MAPRRRIHHLEYRGRFPDFARAHRPDPIIVLSSPPPSCVRECHALLNLTLQFRHHPVEPHLLVRGQFAEGGYLLDTVPPDTHGRREEGRVRDGALHERALDDAFAPDRPEEVLREDVSRVRHGEGGASGSGLRRHDLVASEFCFCFSSDKIISQRFHPFHPKNVRK